MNIGIFLKQFKRPVKDMIEQIKSGSVHSFGSGKLRELYKLLPDEGELKQLASFKGDHSALPEADLFMLLLVRIPSYEVSLRGLLLREEFFPLVEEIKEFIGTLTAAGKELLESDSLHSVIRLVLKTGNYMNAGGYAGSAVGFRMASLLKLVDTKANKPGMNLMHYVVMQAQKADMALLNFPEQLKHIEAAAKINKGDIEAEFGRQVKKVQDAKADMLKQENLKEQMEDFLKEAEVCLAEIETHLQELQSVSDSVAEYFCEDPNKFKLEECCSVFNSFCEKFMRAVQENKAREMAEVKLRQRDRLQSTAKRRSIATCSSRDKEMDGIALESVLQNYLTNRVSRRRSGMPSSSHGSPVSGSPNSGSLSEITAQANLPTGKKRRGGSNIDKEWNSTVELTEESSHSKAQSNGMDNKSKGGIPYEEKMKTSRKANSRQYTHPAKVTPSISSSVNFSATTDDGEEDLEYNNEEEAQKLREASKKVLHFQNSCGSISSIDYTLESQKSPGANTTLRRQRTVDEDTEGYLGEPADEDLVKLFLDTESPPACNLGRRHTVPTKVSKTKEEEVSTPVRASYPVASENGKLPADGDEHHPSKEMLDFTDLSHSFKKPGTLDENSLAAEKKSKPNVCPTQAADEMPGEQKQEGKSVEPSDNHMQSNSENIPPKSTWNKAENSGLFFSFLKRLGDLSKQQSSKEAVHNCTGSGV
nr:protein diaphanous homolog 3-like isoform X2 [Monopterus albus]